MENILEIYENQASLKYASYSQHSEFARTLFPVESTSNIKIKITHHRVMEIDVFAKEYQSTIKFYMQSL